MLAGKGWHVVQMTELQVANVRRYSPAVNTQVGQVMVSR